MITDGPPISIGIPFFNAESTLLDAVRSVFAQTHVSWELILLDDGSTDRSLELALSIDDPRVRVYSDGKNKRLATRLNELRYLVRTEYIARMDADDLMAPTRLARQLEVLVANPDVDLVSTGVLSLTDDYEPVGVRCVAPGHSILPRALLGGHSGIVHASVIGRKAWFDRNSYRQDLPISQDTNLWVRAYSRNDLRVAFVPEPMYYYREDGSVNAGKLLRAYHIGRQTILRDAGSRFRFVDRAAAFAASSARSVAVGVLDSLGRLDVIRARRVPVQLENIQKERLEGEIASIRALELPLRKNTKTHYVS
ncbi:glycosyltransferase family A protein [Lysobacter sp. A03]|uniref:glycosyltransferase family 2 protein n=1 Tax=Lysobacter sp. A03 TaxID=1199154 RepID=UPI0005C6A32F|nr:glycosyltransferase family A protein [Lysobacter sp. A03]